MSRLNAASLLAATLLVIGCGAKVQFDGESATGGGSADGGSTSSAGNASSNGGSGSGNGSANGGSSSTQTAGGGTTTSTSNGGSSAQGGGSSSSGVVGIPCGNSVCDSAGQACCLTQNGDFCVGLDEGCPGIELTCTGAATCGSNELCCLVGSMGNIGSECVADAQCPNGPGPGNNGVQLCESSAECPQGKVCEPNMFGILRCHNP